MTSHRYSLPAAFAAGTIPVESINAVTDAEGDMKTSLTSCLEIVDS
jgi:hypothetical protein